MRTLFIYFFIFIFLVQAHIFAEDKSRFITSYKKLIGIFDSDEYRKEILNNTFPVSLIFENFYRVYYHEVLSLHGNTFDQNDSKIEFFDVLQREMKSKKFDEYTDLFSYSELILNMYQPDNIDKKVEPKSREKDKLFLTWFVLDHYATSAFFVQKANLKLFKKTKLRNPENFIGKIQSDNCLKDIKNEDKFECIFLPAIDSFNYIAKQINSPLEKLMKGIPFGIYIFPVFLEQGEEYYVSSDENQKDIQEFQTFKTPNKIPSNGPDFWVLQINVHDELKLPVVSNFLALTKHMGPYSY